MRFFRVFDYVRFSTKKKSLKNSYKIRTFFTHILSHEFKFVNKKIAFIKTTKAIFFRRLLLRIEIQ